MSSKRLLLDVRHRQALVESVYVEHLHTSVRFLCAVKEDQEILLDYLGQNLRVTEPLNVASGISTPNQRKFYEHQAEEWISSELAILVTDCFEVCGVGMASLKKNKHQKRLLQLDNDYSEKITKGIAPSEEGKFMRVFLDELHSYASSFLPESCNEYMQIDLLHLHEEYQGAGIGHRLLKELLKLAKLKGQQYVVIGCNSAKLKRLCEKFKFQSKFTIPYAKFVCNGEPVFGEQLHDESTEAHLMIVNLSEIENLLQDGKPTLPNAYKLPKTERRLVGEEYVERLGHSIRYEIGQPEDEPVVRDFMTNEYYRQTNIPRTLQCRKEDGAELMTRFKPEVLQQGLVILAIDEGKLCGLSINRGMPVERKGDEKNKNEKVKVPEDFTPLINAQPLEHIGGKTVRAVNSWMESQIWRFLPSGADQFFMLNMLTVHPDYRGCKIANKLWTEALKLGQEKGFRYVQCMCSAAGSNRVAEKIGLAKVIDLKYSQVTYNGRELFENGRVNDGGEEFNMYIGDLNEIFKE